MPNAVVQSVPLRSPTSYGTAVVLFALLAAISLASSLAFATACVLLAMLTYVIQRQRLFSCEGYMCLVGCYYWLGIVNPFNADVHGVVWESRIIVSLVILVTAGIALLWLGWQYGRRIAVQALPAKTSEASPETRFERLARASYCLMTF